jgi:hypothetical protein
MAELQPMTTPLWAFGRLDGTQIPVTMPWNR